MIYLHPEKRWKKSSLPVPIQGKHTTPTDNEWKMTKYHSLKKLQKILSNISQCFINCCLTTLQRIKKKKIYCLLVIYEEYTRSTIAYGRKNIILKLVGVDWSLLSSPSYTYTHGFSLIGS